MNNNSPESFRPGQGLSSPTNQSLQQSLYIAALDRHLGIRGLISPVTDTSTGLDYDFFDSEGEQLIKIFKSLAAEDLVKYEEGRPEIDPLYIIDGTGLTAGLCKDCGQMHPSLQSKGLTDAALVFDALLYADDQLWEFCEEDHSWVPITPIQRELCLQAIHNLADL